MKENGLTLERKRYKAKRHRARKAIATTWNQHWQTDMTKFEIPGLGWVFLFLVVDIFSRKIVGWHLSARARAKDALMALEMALTREIWPRIHHGFHHLTLRSDNGCQYLSKAFYDYIKRIENLIKINHELTGYNQPEGDAYIERAIRTVKEEEIWLNEYQNFIEARDKIARFIKFYNEERLHSVLAYRSPKDYIEDFLNKSVLPKAC